CFGRGHWFLWYAGADDVESVERRFPGDLGFEPMDLEAALLDREREFPAPSGELRATSAARARSRSAFLSQ
ncbi:MAG TPA: hypothetical protein VND80_10445, partial [Steroidobacteraceae bacterium]|nr:hypothetical protein [Steroidobacteraceae bacterium]